jgi:hypothetical protein
MFTNMKPLPKMLIIGAIAAGAVFGATKLVATHKANAALHAAEVQQVEPVPVPAEAAAAPAQQVEPPKTADNTPIDEPETPPTVTSGDAGMKALLAKGKKQ